MLNLPMVQLEAASCGLSGALPDVQPGDLATTKLQRLDLHGNQLQGSIPASWATLTSLGCLQLHMNPDLCGDIPNDLPCFDTLGTFLGKP